MVVRAATAAAGVFVVMVVMAAATAAGALVMMVMTAATAAAAVHAGQRNRGEGFVGGRHGQANALEHDLVLFDAGHGKAVFGLRHANAAGRQGIDGFLHEVEVARDLVDRFNGSFHLVKAALFVNEHVANFERAHFTEAVFDRLAVDFESSGQLMALHKGQFNRSGTVKNRLGGLAVGGQKFRNTHDGIVKKVPKTDAAALGAVRSSSFVLRKSIRGRQRTH